MRSDNSANGVLLKDQRSSGKFVTISSRNRRANSGVPGSRSEISLPSGREPEKHCNPFGNSFPFSFHGNFTVARFDFASNKNRATIACRTAFYTVRIGMCSLAPVVIPTGAFFLAALTLTRRRRQVVTLPWTEPGPAQCGAFCFGSPQLAASYQGRHPSP